MVQMSHWFSYGIRTYSLVQVWQNFGLWVLLKLELVLLF